MWTDLNPILVLELEKPENADIKEELLNPKFASREHYSRATYAAGCRGPLCRKSEKDRGRKRNAKKAARAGREYKSLVNEDLELNVRDYILDIVIYWHLTHPDEYYRRASAHALAYAKRRALARKEHSAKISALNVIPGANPIHLHLG